MHVPKKDLESCYRTRKKRLFHQKNIAYQKSKDAMSESWIHNV